MSSTTAPRTPPFRHCRRSPGCATTAAPATAASSPPATTARRSPLASTWCSSTTTRCRSRAGWMPCCARSTSTGTLAWSGRSCCIRTGDCRKRAAWCSPTAAAGITGGSSAPDDCRHAYVRDCDYASGAAIAIPRALFVELGGFDTRYAPAYYEDTDLAFAVRAHGRRVLYQPAARGRARRRRDRRHRYRQRRQGLPGPQPRTLRRKMAGRAAAPARRRPRTDAGAAACADAAGAGHRCADPARGPRFRFAAPGQSDAPVARGRRARGVPAGQPRPCRPLHRRVAATRGRNLVRAVRRTRARVAARTWPALRQRRGLAPLRRARIPAPAAQACAAGQDRVRFGRPALPARAARRRSRRRPRIAAGRRTHPRTRAGRDRASRHHAGGERSRARRARARRAAGAGRNTVQPAPAVRAGTAFRATP